MTDWSQPQEVDGLAMAFGGNVAALMPPHAEIPDEFRSMNSRNTWAELQRDWFYQGLPSDTTFVPREGVDPKAAVRHLKAIQASWEPKHEHKEAAVAYLASLWFERVESAHKSYGDAA